MNILQDYRHRQKIIKAAILFFVVLAAMLLFILAPTVVRGQTLDTPVVEAGSSQTIEVAQAGSTGNSNCQPGQPCDVCGSLGGCVGNITDYSSNANGIFLLLKDAAMFLVYISFGFATIIIVIAGYKMMMSNGDETRYKEGVNTLKYAVFGLILGALSFTIVLVVTFFVQGIDIGR